MCVTSMVGDFYGDKWLATFPKPAVLPWLNVQPELPKISREEFDALKKDVADMRELLKRAKLYDEQNNEPSCEMQEKVEFLKKLAAMVGVSLDDIFPKATPAA